MIVHVEHGVIKPIIVPTIEQIILVFVSEQACLATEILFEELRPTECCELYTRRLRLYVSKHEEHHAVAPIELVDELFDLGAKLLIALRLNGFDDRDRLCGLDDRDRLNGFDGLILDRLNGFDGFDRHIGHATVDQAGAFRSAAQQLRTRDRIMVAMSQISTIGNETRKEMLNIVGSNTECLMSNEECAVDDPGDLKEHGKLGVEEAVEQILRAALHRRIEIVERNPRKQICHFGHLLHSFEHGICSHHQLHQRGELSIAMINERQEIQEVVDAELKVLAFGLVSRQLVDRIRQPVIVILPMVGCDETFERRFGSGTQLFIARDRIQPHQSEDRFAVVIHDPERLFNGVILRMQHVHETAVGLLHGVNASCKCLHQRQIFFGLHEDRMLDEHDERDTQRAEFDLIAVEVNGVCGFRAVLERSILNEGLQSVLECFVDRRAEFRVTHLAIGLVHVEHGEDRTEMSKCIIRGDDPAGAWIVTVDESTVGFDFARKV